MKTRLTAIAAAVSIAATLLVFTIALADPADPFSAAAEGTAVNANLTVGLTAPPFDVDIGVLVGQENSRITGTVSAIETGGIGTGVLVTEDSPFIDAVVQLIATESYKDTTDPGNDTDTDFLASITSLLLNTAVISSSSESESLDPRFTTGEGIINDLEINGGELGAAIIQAGTVSETAHTQSAAAGLDVTANSAVSIEDFSSSLGLALAPTEIITAAAITSSAEVFCDDPIGNESATTDYNFVDLYVLGQEITVFTPGTKVTVTIATVDVALLAIGPEVVEETTATSAQATVVPLRLELLTDFGLLVTGSVIDIGTSTASCQVSEALAITNQGIEAQQKSLPVAFIAFGLVALTGSTVAIWQRRKNR